MKIPILTVILFSSVVAYGQLRVTTTIELLREDCRNANQFLSDGVDSVKLYKLPGGKLLYAIKPRHAGEWPIIIKNAPIGEYKVHFKNYFGQAIQENITLSNDSINYIRLCADSLLGAKQNTLENLAENDSISVYFHTQGCFHAYAKKITVTRENEKLIARYYDVGWKYVKKNRIMTLEFTNEKLSKTVTMTKMQEDAFTRFENELLHVNLGGCTTVDTYEMKARNLSIKKKDGSCTWLGFQYLSVYLFGTIK